MRLRPISFFVFIPFLLPYIFILLQSILYHFCQNRHFCKVYFITFAKTTIFVKYTLIKLCLKK